MAEKAQTLHEALFAVQQEAPFISKATDNPFFKARYASMPDIWESIKDLLGKNKLLVMHQLEVIEGADYITTMIYHIPSQSSLVSRSRILLTKSTAQEYGSYITYMRRYAVSAMLGLVMDDDDDGNAATQAKPAPAPVQPVVRSVNPNEMAMLKTGIETALTIEELESAKNNVRAAWHRLDKDQQVILTAAIKHADTKYQGAANA